MYFVAQLIDLLKFKKIGHSRRGRVIGLSSGTVYYIIAKYLLYYNKVYSYKKNCIFPKKVSLTCTKK